MLAQDQVLGRRQRRAVRRQRRAGQLRAAVQRRSEVQPRERRARFGFLFGEGAKVSKVFPGAFVRGRGGRFRSGMCAVFFFDDFRMCCDLLNFLCWFFFRFERKISIEFFLRVFT